MSRIAGISKILTKYFLDISLFRTEVAEINEANFITKIFFSINSSDLDLIEQI
jgi:hypothetical protein